MYVQASSALGLQKCSADFDYVLPELCDTNGKTKTTPPGYWSLRNKSVFASMPNVPSRPV